MSIHPGNFLLKNQSRKSLVLQNLRQDLLEFPWESFMKLAPESKAKNIQNIAFVLCEYLWVGSCGESEEQHDAWNMTLNSRMRKHIMRWEETGGNKGKHYSKKYLPWRISSQNIFLRTGHQGGWQKKLVFHLKNEMQTTGTITCTQNLSGLVLAGISGRESLESLKQAKE